MKTYLCFFILLFRALISINAQEQDESAYLKTLTDRSQKIVNTLDIKDPEVYQRVTDILVTQYRSLGVIHDAKDSEEVKSLKLHNLHCEFIGQLASELTPEQIDKVKDGMTYGIVKVTYDSYCDMIPTLKPEEKRQLMTWLIEAREHAMDAASSNKKHEWFGKYKGRFNNYIAKRGYDSQQERKAWEERLKSKQEVKKNQIPDFSYSGYKASDMPVPDVEIKIVVPPTGDDATEWIQAAINQISLLPPDKNGFRGAILLQPGDYKISGSLRIAASGIVLRGSGADKNGSRLIAAGKDRRTLIQIAGINDRRAVGDTLPIADKYVPVGAMELTVSGKHTLKIGDKITVVRPSVKEWIDVLGMAHFGGGISSLGWKPGEHNLYWDRTIVSVDGNRLTLDAPVTTALDKQYGGGYVIPYSWEGRIINIGVENMQCVSEYNTQNLKDEAHSWIAVSIANTVDAWVRNITFRHFAGSAVFVLETAKRITVENCKSLAPVSEIGGQRRNAFFTMGQQCLFQRLYSEYAYHDFALGYCTTGPNAFVECFAYLPYSFSGPISSWASGVLFDIVNSEGNALRYTNLSQDNQGAGWNGANSVFWQCSPSYMECFAPPTAMNWSFGSWSEFSGNGYWEDSNNHIQPRSLFYSQLEKRLGKNYVDRSDLIRITTNATTSPSIALAQELTQVAREAAPRLYDWIDQVIAKHPVLTNVGKAKILTDDDVRRYRRDAINSVSTASIYPLTIENGRLVRNHQLQTGGTHRINYWNGNLRPSYLNNVARPHLTRFVPGRVGTGLTDDVDSVVQWMKSSGIIAIDHNYGLWYERRRDDHERIRRMSGDVWAPFYEQPFARSGQGAAYDGLSKYDLTQYNDWYWSRLKQFADAADQNDLVLLHQNYFQHNIIEAGAHWADSPWRPVNNINNTAFPEPPNYAGDKRIFMAEHFYDITNPARRDLHRAYIRKCLDNFKDNHSVIQLISEEFTGPLHFVEFWLDVVAEWEKETGQHPLIALSATKDVQDAILTDPNRSKIVDIIDIRYWMYRADGTLYAPEGGLNLAPRQHARLTAPGRVSPESVYRAVNEYRTRYPEKAVLYYSEGYSQYGQAVFDAGGSLPAVKKKDNEKEVYLFTSFHEPADEGLRLLYSEDGYRWDSLSGVFLKPDAGKQKVMRDPSMVKGPDGTFHLVWTCSWNQDPGFAYASSKDLIHWSEQKHIPVMAHDTSVVNVWAPELFYEDSTGEYYIVWASTIPFKFEKGIEEERNNHRLYYTKTKNFVDFTPAELFYDPGFSSIDAVIVKRASSDYVLVFKDNTRPERNILAAFGKTAVGPYGNMTERFTEMFTEGPSVAKVGDQWLIYFDSYRNKTYNALATKDFRTFTDVSNKISIPQGHKHGTILKVPASVVEKLKNK